MIRFRLRTSRVELSFPFFASVTLLLLLGKGSAAAAAAIAAHEGGHLLMLFLLRAPPKRIRFHLCGIDLEKRSALVSYRDDALVSLAGPAANLLLGFFGLPLSFWFGLAHLLPILSLDGGNALFALLSGRFSRETAGRAVYLCSFFFLLPLGVLSVRALLTSQGNYSLLFVFLYLLFGLIFRKKEDF